MPNKKRSIPNRTINPDSAHSRTYVQGQVDSLLDEIFKQMNPEKQKSKGLTRKQKDDILKRSGWKP